MGKIVTIYLTDDEARELKTFCDENQCTRYSALKTAVKQILSQPLQCKEEETQDIIEENQEEDIIIDEVDEETLEESEEDEEIEEETKGSHKLTLKRLRQTRPTL